jgi:hypothetical protein
MRRDEHGLGEEHLLRQEAVEHGTPAIAALATSASVTVIGIAWTRPLRRRMSRVPVSWSMMPAAMNSDALNVAWLMMWNTAATAASGLLRPSSSVMRPRWLIVEYASRRFRSFWNIARYAPSTSVVAPAPVTIQNHASLPASAGHSRASRNTPAFTIVAECKYADTGVGAAIACGSQKWNGNCALLVSAPSSTSTSAAG